MRDPSSGIGEPEPLEYLAHMEDSFLIRTTSLHATSERRGMANPRKAYPVDPRRFSVCERSGRPKWGHTRRLAIRATKITPTDCPFWGTIARSPLTYLPGYAGLHYRKPAVRLRPPSQRDSESCHSEP